MRATIKPLLISLLRGARNHDKSDSKKIKFIHSLKTEELQQIDDQLVAFLRIELDKLVLDKLIAERFQGLSENNETAVDGS